MKQIRAVLKLFLLTIYTIGIYLIYAIVLAFIKLFRLRYEPWRNLMMSFWAYGLGWILNITVNVVGTPPTPPFFLVSNHLSYLDIVPLYQILKCNFVAKKEVKSWPLLGFMVKSMGVIFIDRTRKKDVKRVNKLVSEELNEYQGIILFPEGTTSPGCEILPFRPPLLEHPAASEVPVHYASIHYKTDEKDEPAHNSICWWGGVSFPGHVYRLAGTRKIECTVTFGDKVVRDKDRKKLAELLQHHVEKQFIPVVEKGSIVE